MLIIAIAIIIVGVAGWMVGRRAQSPAVSMQKTTHTSDIEKDEFNQSFKQDARRDEYDHIESNIEKIFENAVSSPMGSSDIVYSDSVNGYQLKLPSSWLEFKVFNGKFMLPTADNNWVEFVGEKRL